MYISIKYNHITGEIQIFFRYVSNKIQPDVIQIYDR